MSGLEWHGWTVGDRGTIHVGPLPGRKSICVYVIEGSVMTPLAYCRSSEDGQRLLRVLDGAFAPVNLAGLHHRQRGREDGSWGCACGWVQDRPHREHVAEMTAAVAEEAAQ